VADGNAAETIVVPHWNPGGDMRPRLGNAFRTGGPPASNCRLGLVTHAWRAYPPCEP
jgi:hypothetical protein